MKAASNYGMLKHMLATIKGKISDIFQDFFIIENNGLGYKIKSHVQTFINLAVGHEKRFYIHEHIREDAYDLYGFATMDELAFFERLLGVSGVGPKAALAVCSAAPLDTLMAKLAQGDLDWLSSQQGIGKKTAQKIILELKGKLVEPGTMADADRELVEALTNLGYTAFQARETSKRIPEDVKGPADRLRAALKILSR